MGNDHWWVAPIEKNGKPAVVFGGQCAKLTREEWEEYKEAVDELFETMDE